MKPTFSQLLIVMVSMAWVCRGQPANDNFADQILLSGMAVVTSGSNIGATREPDEPQAGSFQRALFESSVWWSWTAPTNGLLRLTTAGSDFNTQLAVYTGTSISNLAEVAYNDNDLYTVQSEVGFHVIAGATYRLAVGGIDGSQGHIELNLSFWPSPPNDNFAGRIDLGSGHARLISTNIGATTEPGEPDYPYTTNSVWWSWTAQTSGPVTVTAIGASVLSYWTPWIRLRMFTGTSISSLNQVAAQEDYTTLLIGQVTVEAEAGTTYQICVDGDLGLPGTFSLNVAQTRPPIVILTDSPNQGNYLSDSCVPLAAQAFDPDGSVRQVEFRLTDQTYYAYRPVGLATNRPFSINWTNPSLSWHSVIALATDDLGAIGMSIPITFNVRPPNDDFAKRIALTGSFLTVTGSTLGATLEPGEPSANDSSIWWSWTAPADGPVTLTTPGNYALAVYTGSSVSSLTQVAYSTSADFGYTTRLVFAAAAGGTYQLAVNRQLGVGGDLTLQIARHLPPIVVVVSPTNQSRFINSDVLLIAADASDSGGAITRVDFYQDWMLIGTVTNPPYDLTVTLSATSLVGHSLQVWATDDHGITTASAAVYYEVSPPGPPNDNFANRIAITGAGLAVTGTLAYATGEIGEPGNLDAHSVWWAWTAPATATFTCTIVSELGFYPAVGVFAGTAVTNLSLVAYNAFNGSDNSYSARVTFEAATATTYAIGAAIIAGTPGGQYALSIGQGTPPTITISSPTNGSVFEAGTNITITAEASDSDGIVTQVSFYDNSTLLGVDTQAPFSITLSNAQPHYYSIIAVATDDSHLTTPSNPVYFSVNSSPPQPVSRPPNDDFTNRTILTGSFVIVTGSLANATMAVGEQGQCIWWSWTAPETALFTITLQSEPGYYPALSLYTGTDLLDLVLVTNSAFFGLDYSYSTRFIISASAGATYQIAASSLSK